MVKGTYLVLSPSSALLHIGRRSPSIPLCPLQDRLPHSTSLYCIVLYLSIYIAPLNSHGQTEALLVELAPRKETSFKK